MSEKRELRVFKKVENVSDLEPILRDRLPMSTNIFNMCLSQSKWSTDVRWYVLDGEISMEAWIVTTYTREDYGLEVAVSRPPKAIVIPDDVREAFSQSSLIDWGGPFIFATTDSEVTAMVTDISIRDKGNYTHVVPANLYYMDVDEAVNLSENFDSDSGVETASIGNPRGEEFILNTWKFKAEGSEHYVRDVLERNLSAGVYVNGKVVAGALFAVHGLISMLYTRSDYRGKGYAQSAMRLFMKNCAGNGLVPGCTVELRNEACKAFVTKLGFKVAGVAAYVFHKKPSF